MREDLLRGFLSEVTMRRLLLCLSLMLASPAFGAEVAVFVGQSPIAAREVDDATKKDLSAKQGAASQTRKALEKEMMARYGKKRETWPQQEEERLAVAEEVEARASADHDYVGGATTGAVANAAKEVTGKLSYLVKQKAVTLVPSATDADLVLQVEGSRGEASNRSPFGRPDSCFVLFSIRPGGKAGAADRLAKVPASWRPRKTHSRKVQSPVPEAPVFTFESYHDDVSVSHINPALCPSMAANATAETLQKMLEDNKALAGN